MVLVLLCVGWLQLWLLQLDHSCDDFCMLVVVVHSFYGWGYCGLFILVWSVLAVCVVVDFQLPRPNVSNIVRLYQKHGFPKKSA